MTAITLSNAQQRVIENAAKSPDATVEKFMSHMPAAAKQAMLGALVKKRCVTRRATGYFLTKAGLTAIGLEEPATQVKTPKADKPKRVSKQSTMLDMLRQGTTIQAIMDVTSWQKHTVHGSMANLKKKLGLTIASDKAEGGERIYRIT